MSGYCSPTFDGVLLAAGRSRRMGSDKALVPVAGGRVLWERQVDVLRAAGVRRLWISARPDQGWVPAGAAVVTDERADAGPLAGVVAAWRKSEASHLLVLAVDLPDLPASWLARLMARAKEDCGVAGCHPTGIFEPLAACYPRAWLPDWSAALQSGRLSVQQLLSEADAGEQLVKMPIGSAETPWFRNLNSPADLRSE
ncbi:MAG: molybdenum cofactor guanylyltransferase [Opitutaceae bacterium]|nr:molybdenum cofactor guanylyltransferase [Opitutaceae bacterium]